LNVLLGDSLPMRCYLGVKHIVDLVFVVGLAFYRVV